MKRAKTISDYLIATLWVTAVLIFGGWFLAEGMAAYAAQQVRFVGDTQWFIWSVREPTSQPVKKVQMTLTFSPNVQFVSAAKPTADWVSPDSVTSEKVLPGGLSIVKNSSTSITLAYDNGADAMIKGAAAEIAVLCVDSGPVTISITNLTSWNAAGTQFDSFNGITEDQVVIRPKLGTVVVHPK